MGANISECLREERLGRQLLFFQVRIKDHGQIANENSSQPSGPNFIGFEKNEAIFAGRLQARQFAGKIFIKIDVKFARDLFLDDDGVAKQSADDCAPQLVILG